MLYYIIIYDHVRIWATINNLARLKTWSPFHPTADHHQAGEAAADA